MVINLGMLKAKQYGELLQEMKSVKNACSGKLLKVIIETCLLTDSEITAMCDIVAESGADFIKTSTGFSTEGATFHSVELMKRGVYGRIKVKASGGISSLEDAEKYMELGADRLGTSKVVKIIKNEGHRF